MAPRVGSPYTRLLSEVSRATCGAPDEGMATV
jgi:hypothetical protein